jgi:isocitrate/isopropylmalate dehydrogenase
MLRSVALMLELAFEQQEAAEALRQAVATALAETPTADLGGSASTSDFTDKVVAVLAE